MASMLTTVDNPHDPRDDFIAWFNWDVEHGYNTCSYLARIAVVSEDFPESVQDQELETAMDDIVNMHNGEIWKKVPLPVAS